MPSSFASSNDEALDTPINNPTPEAVEELLITSSLEDLQTDEQRRVLDTVAQVRKCGLESILSLPQLVVCGDQSAGKSSVLEALTEIPFPRNDNLCTRHPTEIILRRGPINLLTVKVIPGGDRPQHEQEKIKAFEETISDFADLPKVMDMAMVIMGISKDESSEARAFAQDVLSIEIEGPTRPQLTLVDIPGLIQSSTKGVSDADVDLVAEITNRYIKQPRTICLAVVSAMSDAANQAILRKVRQRDVDPEGNRTLGIITKPDQLSKGSGSEAKFVELAKNQDVFFKLGWHVLRNRRFEEGNSSLLQRNEAEKAFFRDPASGFSSLPKDNVGISALRNRLSVLLFEHVKQELPKLRQDLETALVTAQDDLTLLGTRRSKPQECRAYLSQLSLDYYELCKAAVNGHYEGNYFSAGNDEPFLVSSLTSIRRLRAVVQHMNTEFSENVRKNGQKYWISTWSSDGECSSESDEYNEIRKPSKNQPVKMTKAEALRWVEKALIRTRGKELVGSFNPLLVGELFWEQSSRWPEFAKQHIEQVARVCQDFLDHLLGEKCPKDVKSRIWASQMLQSLKERRKSAIRELDSIIEDLKSFPINYNHYYTDTISKRRLDRQKAALRMSLEAAVKNATACDNKFREVVDVEQVVDECTAGINPNMDDFSCEEALDSLLAIYKVSLKTFVANITTQVIERHIVRGLENIFSPVVANSLSDAEVQALASEPTSAKRQREFLEDRIARLEEGHEIFRSVMSGTLG